MRISEQLPASWEACIQVKKQQLELDMEQGIGSKCGKEYVKAVFSPCILNLYAVHHAKCWARWSIVVINTAGRDISNLRYADDTNLRAECEEQLKSFLIKVKEEKEKAGLKLNIQKTKIMASGHIISWQTHEETMETMTDFIFLGSKITADGDSSHEIKRCLLLGR